jgi:tetratricopeptide (TPR) repeat protein
VLTGLVVAACAALFLSRNWPRKAVVRASKISYASELVNHERVDEAIEVLDSIDTRTLEPDALRSWLGMKGYALALAGRGEEALDCIDDLASLADPEDAGHQLLVCGTRAIVAIDAEKWDDAADLLDATERFSSWSQAIAPSNLAEVWWWRAELARRRGDEARRRECLKKAAELGDVHYADRARAALQSVAAT